MKVPMEQRLDGDGLKELIKKVQRLVDYSHALETKYAKKIRKAHSKNKESAKNLVHYIALRQHDVRRLQRQLAVLGLSSLSHSESHVTSNLQLILSNLNRFADNNEELADDVHPSLLQGQKLLTLNTEALLGLPTQDRNGRIMVTMPIEAAHDYELVKDLIHLGMNAARINCAHDSEVEWLAMISNIKQARKSLNLECKIIMDLAGPKIRTGKLVSGPKILKWSAIKNIQGEVVEPAIISIKSSGSAGPEPINSKHNAFLYMPQNWMENLRKGDRIILTDLRGKKRKLKVAGLTEAGILAASKQTTYVEPGTVLRVYRPLVGEIAAAPISDVKSMEAPIVLRKGDLLRLTKDQEPGHPAMLNDHGDVIKPASVACTYPEIFNDVREEEPIYIDDGKIAGRIITAAVDHLTIEITAAKPNGSKLRADKGINFPESNIKLTGLTNKDLKDLDFIVEHADIVGLSFVNRSSDIKCLLKELKIRQNRHIGIIVKIETQKGFKNLPWILLTAMQNYPIGVMIARGDLAIECGWVRMAELQEELMWFCEAAHIPVIWATQVLDRLIKTGLPSRAEITDAAMAQRAECVMLNKGPYILNGIKILDSILRRMQQHQTKKYSKLRRLGVSIQFDS